MSLLTDNLKGAVPFLLFFALAHMFKAARFYLVLLERDIPLRRYLFLYARTTLVNLAIPFKLGELYRFAAVHHVTSKSEKSPHAATSFLSVCVDRYFDTVALLVIIIPFGLMYNGRIDFVPLLLFLALLVLALVYFSIPQSYRYLNEYIIMYRRTKRSVNMLGFLEVIKEWHDFTGGLIKGRAPLMLIASFLGWAAEFMALRGFYEMAGSSFAMEDFGRYINSLLAGSSDSMAIRYNATGIAIFAAVTVVFCIMWVFKAGERNAANPDRV
ncbi:MAG: flippase-like domain-containing protein [Lachnospiraceae bacterium]|nr:flippase-like domain-containing protein [Lachnospiraceae bacterium]